MRVTGFSGGMMVATMLVLGTAANVQFVACGGNGGGGGSATNDVPPVSQAPVALAALWKVLDRSKALGRVKSHFAFKRVEATASAHADWKAEPGQPKVLTRVQAEILEVEAFVLAKLGDGASIRGSLTNGASDPTPHHIDLDIASNYKTGLSEEAKTKRAADYRSMRFLRGSKIVWRAAAVEPGLWQATDPTDPASPVQLDHDKLSTILDRRLHAIERMECNVNVGDAKYDRKWTISNGAHGPWKDQQLARTFEYPWLPYRPFAAVRDDMEADGWLLDGAPSDPRASLQYPSTRVPNALKPYFRLATSNPDTWLIFHPEGGSDLPATVITRLVTPSPDFLLRSWLYCDQVIATLNVEGLVFALRRRDGNDTLFNALVTNPAKPDYLQLGTMVRFATDRPMHVLMNDDPDDVYFGNTPMPLTDLQIGDHPIVWNNAAYDLLSSEDWRNENSLVMDVEGDPQAGVGAQEQLYVAGHGISTRKVGDMIDNLATELSNALGAAYKLIAANPTANQLPLVIVRNTTIVRWDPYGEFGATPPWWLRVQPSDWSRWNFQSLDQARTAFPRAVVAESPQPARYTPPPGDPNSIFFPLHEPQIAGTSFGEDPWSAYFDSRRSGASSPVILAPIHVDGKLIPGLFYRAANIPAVRPKVV